MAQHLIAVAGFRELHAGKSIRQDLFESATDDRVVVGNQDAHGSAPLGAGKVDGNADRDGGSVAGGCGDLHVASAELRAFFHAQEPEGAESVGRLRILKANAIVLDYQKDTLLLLVKGNAHRLGLRVADDVGQALLKDAERGGGAVTIQMQIDRRMATGPGKRSGKWKNTTTEASLTEWHTSA